MKEHLQEQGCLTRKERFKQWFCGQRSREIEPKLDPNDPFAAEREELTAMMHERPRWLTKMLDEAGEPQDTWYIGPYGPNLVDVMQASEEEYAKYERLAEMVRYDRDKKKHDRLYALGIEEEPFSWEAYQAAQQDLATGAVDPAS